MKYAKIIIPAALTVFAVLAAGIYVMVNTEDTSESPQKTYVALGDSVAAGLGLHASDNNTACGRSDRAYPYIVASQRNLQLKHLACSGATMEQGLLGSQNGESPQIARIYEGSTPSLISATIGANDLGWTKLLGKCYQTTCGTPQDTALVDANLQTLDANLRKFLSAIESHDPKSVPKTILTAYYQVLPANKKYCPRVDALQASEFSWWQTQEDKLNDTIQNAVDDYDFARYASVDYSGHDVCEFGDESWVQGLTDEAPFHPTDVGQAVIAGAVLTALGQ